MVTFDPHPAKVLRPKSAPHLLTATQHKLSLIRNLGVAHLLVINFDKKFAATPPEDFVQQLATYSKALREICVGHEWSFGKDRRGNLNLLNKLWTQALRQSRGVKIRKVSVTLSDLVAATDLQPDLFANLK